MSGTTSGAQARRSAARSRSTPASGVCGVDARAVAWRDGYRKWRQGRARGARGDSRHACAKPFLACSMPGCSPRADGLRCVRTPPAVVYDVVAAEGTATAALLPVDGPQVAPVPVGYFPEDAVVVIRCFRFFEDRSDEKAVWEQELRNVNSGSLLWLPVHLQPGLHSKAGAKYGSWFTIHYLQVYAKHFKSHYFMAEEGCCPAAKTFGCAGPTTMTVTGSKLKDGYFWYVTPARGEANLEREGWQHFFRAGPFDGNALLDEWRSGGRPMEARALQQVLDQCTQV